MNNASSPSPRQTQRYLRQLLEARGLRPKSKLGQSFLIDLNLLELLVRTAELGQEDLVIEVGTGSGSMTALLCQQAGAVIGVEIDPDFCELARENTASFSNVTLVASDILKSKNQLNPVVLETIAKVRAASAIRCLKLVANLPFVVATPVISNFLMTDLPFERMVVTIQWELGERLAARPSTKDYSALSVLVQSLADVEIVRRIPPTAFWPKPQVDSAIVLIWPRAEKRGRIADLPSFQAFIRELYLHRRKNLRGALLPVVRERFAKDELDRLLVAHGFDPAGRAEALSVEEHLRLFDALMERK
jgi:16S rRNA (adenine1518-N6/adenine1519-N6)-dimethyltransferase